MANLDMIAQNIYRERIAYSGRVFDIMFWNDSWSDFGWVGVNEVITEEHKPIIPIFKPKKYEKYIDVGYGWTNDDHIKVATRMIEMYMEREDKENLELSRIIDFCKQE